MQEETKTAVVNLILAEQWLYEDVKHRRSVAMFKKDLKKLHQNVLENKYYDNFSLLNNLGCPNCPFRTNDSKSLIEHTVECKNNEIISQNLKSIRYQQPFNRKRSKRAVDNRIEKKNDTINRLSLFKDKDLKEKCQQLGSKSAQISIIANTCNFIHQKNPSQLQLRILSRTFNLPKVYTVARKDE
uniref:Uncharacterized protein n=1 Tax=Rhodnius prolixus TaxID=13249 RepID=T1HPX9_RHOPR